MISEKITRRGVLAMGASAGASALAVKPGQLVAQARPEAMTALDPVTTELVMNLVVTCSPPEPMGPNRHSQDGTLIIHGRTVGAYIARR